MINKERNPFSEFLRKYRKDNKLTLNDISEKLAIPLKQYSRYENGIGFPVNYNIKKISNLNGIDSNALYTSLLQTDKKILKARFARLLINADIEKSDLLEIVSILSKYL